MSEQMPGGQVPPPPQYGTVPPQGYMSPGPVVPQAPKKRSPVLWIILGLVVVFCLLPIGSIGAITLLGKAVTTTTINSSTGAGKVDAAGQQGTGKDKPAPIGTAVSPAKGWTVQVNSAEPNANATMKAANEFNSPQDGKQFVLVNVTVANKSEKAEAPTSNVKVSLLTSSGQAIDTFSSFCGEVPDQASLTDQVQPGGTVTGNLCFEVPTAGVEGASLLAEPVFSADQIKDQQYLAIK